MIRIKRKLLALDSTLLIAGSLFFQCCSSPFVRVENDIFSICYPKAVRVVDQPISIYKGVHIVNGTDTVLYNIGFVVSNLCEDVPSVTYIPDYQSYTRDTGMAGQGALVTSRRDYDIDRYRKQSVFFERSGSQIRKYTFPTDTNVGGWVGLYIDSVAWGKDGVLQFNAFVERPSKGYYLTILKALQTIRLTPPKPDSFYVSSRYAP